MTETDKLETRLLLMLGKLVREEKLALTFLVKTPEGLREFVNFNDIPGNTAVQDIRPIYHIPNQL